MWRTCLWGVWCEVWHMRCECRVYEVCDVRDLSMRCEVWHMRCVMWGLTYEVWESCLWVMRPEMWDVRRGSREQKHRTHKPIWINESSVNLKSTSNQSSKPCRVLQYPSREVWHVRWEPCLLVMRREMWDVRRGSREQKHTEHTNQSE